MPISSTPHPVMLLSLSHFTHALLDVVGAVLKNPAAQCWQYGLVPSAAQMIAVGKGQPLT
jgi:hypothetical protein